MNKYFNGKHPRRKPVMSDEDYFGHIAEGMLRVLHDSNGVNFSRRYRKYPDAFGIHWCFNEYGRIKSINHNRYNPPLTCSLLETQTHEESWNTSLAKIYPLPKGVSESIGILNHSSYEVYSELLARGHKLASDLLEILASGRPTRIPDLRPGQKDLREITKNTSLLKSIQYIGKLMPTLITSECNVRTLSYSMKIQD